MAGGAENLSYAWLAGQGDKGIQNMMDLRSRWALKSLGQEQPYPTTAGQGIASLGKSFKDYMLYKKLEDEYAAAEGRAARVPRPGSPALSQTGSLPSEPGTPQTASFPSDSEGIRNAITAASMPQSSGAGWERTLGFLPGFQEASSDATEARPTAVAQDVTGMPMPASPPRMPSYANTFGPASWPSQKLVEVPTDPNIDPNAWPPRPRQRIADEGPGGDVLPASARPTVGGPTSIVPQAAGGIEFGPRSPALGVQTAALPANPQIQTDIPTTAPPQVRTPEAVRMAQVGTGNIAPNVMMPWQRGPQRQIPSYGTVPPVSQTRQGNFQAEPPGAEEINAQRQAALTHGPEKEAWLANLKYWENRREERNAAAKAAADRQNELYKLQENERFKQALEANSPKGLAEQADRQLKLDQLQKEQSNLRRLGMTDKDYLESVRKDEADVSKVAAAGVVARDVMKLIQENPTAFTGANTGLKQAMEQTLAALGVHVSPDIHPRELFQVFTTRTLGAFRPDVVGGSQQSNVELQNLQTASGANWHLRPESMMKVFGAVERLADMAARHHQGKIAEYVGADQPERLGVYNSYSLKNLVDVVPNRTVNALRNDYQNGANPDALRNFNQHYRTPGLAERVLAERD